MKIKTTKKIAAAIIVIMFLMIAGVIYNNKDHSIYIKPEQIKSLSPDQCMFSFSSGPDKMVHVIIEQPKEGVAKSLLDVMESDSIILLKSSKGLLKTGEVVAGVWVNGVRIGCQPDDDVSDDEKKSPE